MTGVCSTANVELVRGLGADHVVDDTETPVTARGQRYDVILDNVGNHRLVELRRLPTPTGRLLINSGERGPDGGPIARILKEAVVSPAGTRKVRSYHSSPNAADLEALARMVARRELAPVLDRAFPFERAADAMTRLATRRARGKIVVAVGGEA